MVRFNLEFKKLKLFFAALFSASILTACGGSLSQLPVAKIEQPGWEYAVDLQEFESKYNDGTFFSDTLRRDTFAAYQDFLDKYITFRLKVKDAQDRGFGQDPSLLQELKDYRAQLAEPYLMERAVMEKNLRDLYDKQQEEINASHILALVSSAADPADTLRAYQKIMEARKLILAGAPFDSVALAFSEDPSVRQNKGNLGYFSGGMMVYQFEDAAYGGKVGELVGPFRTRYGYHIVKIYDRRPKTQPIRASHIMVALPKSPTPSDTLKAYRKAESILRRIQKGEDFQSIAKKESDDKLSGARGGDLGLFGLNRMVKPFETAAFALKQAGDLSPIIRTPFGYHIILLTGREEPKSYDESKELLKRLLSRNSEKLKHERDLFIQQLKETYHFKENESALPMLTAKIDSNSTFAQLDDLDDATLGTVFFTFAEKQTRTLADLIDFMKRFGGKNSLLTADAIHQYAKQYVDETLKSYEIDHLEARYADFTQLMEDYRDGVLLFKVSDETVWSQAAATDSAGRAYYATHKGDFRLGERMKVSEIVVSEKSLADDIYNELTQNIRQRDVVSAQDVKIQKRKIQAQLRKLKKRRDKKSQLKFQKLQEQLTGLQVDDQPRSFEALAARYSETADSLGSAESAIFNRGENRRVDKLFGKPVGFVAAPESINERYRIMRLDIMLPPTEKTYEEARTEIFSILQEQNTRALETEWVNRLRAKSKITVFEDNLKQAFKEDK
ncbi:PpiC-type peptidyl-prolyl cis-trans isomerase [Chloroherpeton thalassium ATCC 35110]|uniref:PpiC-type peptidyl-prolyl cis-trans isomerase n=1 Tax=Chloroherpeton thalassium (strain ATCC 35110 / GB-78) TaxID=517418 RepID=B3QTY6_CHLT3|nr:peptidylprolyl isomerase [Chloroherpeton thalassium]ACF12784.1 PpiC-type peptidyl-prolyl cis-trans isomerase [Chloroherpeton thalassium ATCC 35110]